MAVFMPIMTHLPDVDPESHWSDHGSCRGLTEVFFGPVAERPERRVEREAIARAYCHACPAMTPCRDSARSGLEHGFWGGENDEERAMAGFAPPGRPAAASSSRPTGIPARSQSPDWDGPVS